MTKKQKKRLEFKYIIRRIFLVVLTISLVGGAAYIVLQLVKLEPVSEETAMAEETVVSVMPEPVTLAAPAELSSWNLVLATEANPLSLGHSVELITLADGQKIDNRIYKDLYRMFVDAKADGIDLQLIAGYMTAEQLEEQFEQQVQAYVEGGRSASEARQLTMDILGDVVSNEHTTGLAVDITSAAVSEREAAFADTPASKWLQKHAHIYGFILRYPENKEALTQVSYQPWQYRFVGEQAASVMYKENYCLEEYLYVLTIEAAADEDEPVAEEAGDME